MSTKYYYYTDKLCGKRILLPLQLCFLLLLFSFYLQVNSQSTTTRSISSTTEGVTEENSTKLREETNKPILFEKTKSFGFLCDGDGNDEVGRKLGCDCRQIIYRVPFEQKTEILADCSARIPKLGTQENDIPLPFLLNVSSVVKKLDLSSNELTRVDETTFNEVHNLRELNLAKNKISLVMNLNFSRLENLDLSFNEIKNVSRSFVTPNTAKQIRHLDLSHNNLTFIDTKAFEQLEYLQVLKLGYNQLENIFNYMEDFPFMLNNLTYLEELDLTNGSLPDLPGYILDGTKNLKRLSLKNNLFSYLPRDAFAHLKNLEDLDLSGNYFSHLPPNGFHHLSNLKTLIIDKTRGLQKIEDYAFSGLSSLRVLTCQRNYLLDCISVLAFRGDPSMNCSDSNPKVVQLGYNNLNHFEYPLLHWPTMEEIELHGNPWKCDCNLQWITEFSRRAPINATILIDSDFKCSSPPLLVGTPVAAVEPEEMSCDSTIAMLAEIIALTIFTLLLVFFCLFVALHQYDLLPDRLENLFSLCGDRRLSLPKYTRVQPKPNGSRNSSNPENYPRNIGGDDQELDWDPGDIGRLSY